MIIHCALNFCQLQGIYPDDKIKKILKIRRGMIFAVYGKIQRFF